MTYVQVSAKCDKKKLNFCVPVKRRRDSLLHQHISFDQHHLIALNASERPRRVILESLARRHQRSSPLQSRPSRTDEVNSPPIQPLSPSPSSPYASTPHTSPRPTPATPSHVLWHDFATDPRPYVRINHCHSFLPRALRHVTFRKQNADDDERGMDYQGDV